MKEKERYDTGKAPHIFLEDVAGSLVVKAWEESGVTVKGEHRCTETEKGLTLSSASSLVVYVPMATTLTVALVAGSAQVRGLDGGVAIEQIMGDAALRTLGSDVQVDAVYGDLALHNVEGSVKVRQVMGDAAVRNVHTVDVGVVHGDLALRNVEGDVSVAQVHGDTALRTVNGNVTIQSGQRDVNLSNLGGLVVVEAAEGDVRLRGGLCPGKHALSARGDIVVRWPAGAPLTFTASAPEVVNRLSLDEEMEDEDGLHGRLGEGETVLMLTAQRRVILKELEEAGWEGQWASDFAGDWAGVAGDFAGFGVELAGIGEQISGEIAARMAEFSARMEERFGPEFAQKMADKAARKAEKAVDRAMRQAERVRRQGWAPPHGPHAPEPPRSKKEQQATSEEQLKILSMLEKGVISVEEAETLLSALES